MFMIRCLIGQRCFRIILVFWKDLDIFAHHQSKYLLYRVFLKRQAGKEFLGNEKLGDTRLNTQAKKTAKKATLRKGQTIKQTIEEGMFSRVMCFNIFCA